MRAKLIALTTILALLAGCKKDNGIQEAPFLMLTGKTEITIPRGSDTPQALAFKTNTSWELEIPSDATWLKADKMSGAAEGGATTYFTINFTSPSGDNKTLKTTVKLKYGTTYKNVAVTKLSLPQSSDFDIPDDMIFSTTLGGNLTNVAQGFDYDPDEDIVYIFQKYGAYRNHIAWKKRDTKSLTEATATKMTLSCFSHGNNISIQKMSDGSKYVWAPNYGTRQEDGSYDSPVVVSRFPLAAGQTINNDTTTENYFFGLKPCWPAFDFKNDMVAVCNYKQFVIYKLSDIMALPVEKVNLGYTITYGGTVGVDTKRTEYSGIPTISARDCRKATPLYTVTFDYSKRGLHWQTYCIDNGWIFAILQADRKAAPEIMFDTYVEAYKMDGTKNIYKIQQTYMQNRDRIVSFGWTEHNFFYCEPEGIKVYDGMMLTMYTMRGESSPVIRRPVIFRLASPVN